MRCVSTRPRLIMRRRVQIQSVRVRGWKSCLWTLTIRPFWVLEGAKKLRTAGQLLGKPLGKPRRIEKIWTGGGVRRMHTLP
jgi:hypothetical protein